MNICGGGPRSLIIIIPVLMILCAPTKMHYQVTIEAFSPSYSSSPVINNNGGYCNAFIIDRHNNQLQSLSPQVTHALYYTPPSLSASTMQLFSTSSSTDISNNEEKSVIKTNKPTTKAKATTDMDFTSGIDTIFTSIDIDNSGTIDLDEYNLALSSTQYTHEEIVSSFREIDEDGNGEISREEFYNAITNLQLKQQQKQQQAQSDDNDKDNNNNNNDTIIIIEDPCPMGYWLNSITQQCQPLSPLGTFSQKIETTRMLKPIYNRLVNLKPNRDAIRKSGVSFALAYSIISNLNGAISLSIAWYMTVKRVSLHNYFVGLYAVLCCAVLCQCKMHLFGELCTADVAFLKVVCLLIMHCIPYLFLLINAYGQYGK